MTSSRQPAVPARDPASGDAVGPGEQVVDRGLLDDLGDRVEPEPAVVVGVLAARASMRRTVTARWARGRGT